MENSQALTDTNTATDTDFGVIKRTTDYNRFMYMGGNRNVDVKHVRELMDQMERNREMFASLPILVNENWYIVDGQHRFEAAKALGLPVYYVRQRGVGLSDARQLNIAQKRWGLIDFARSYADSGRQDYVELLRVNDNYPDIALSIIIEYLSGVRGGGINSGKFRRGEFQIADEADATSGLDVLVRVYKTTGNPVPNAFASAMWRVLHHEDFDEEVFLRKLQENPDALQMGTSTRHNLRQIESVFNRHNKLPTRLY